MTILELITAQCGVQGVDKKYAARIEKITGITEEKDGNIIAAVKNFKENVLPAIEDAEKASTEAAKKAIEEYEKKHNLKDGKAINQEPPKSNEGGNDGKDKEIAELKEMLQTVLDKQKSRETLESVRAKLKDKIDEEFISDYIGQVNLEAEDIDAEVVRVAKLYTDMQQKIINKAVADGNYRPIEGSSVSDKSVDEWGKIMEGGDKNAESIGVVDLGLSK